jgi:Xaa-Pro aminopeptidase
MTFLDRIRSKISEIPALRAEAPTAELLDRFRTAQQLSYRCAVEVGRELQEGWTERQTADLMDTWLHDHGVRTFFHTSFAWFGERSRFDGIHDGPRGYGKFMPSSKRVHQPGEVVILDTAPIVDGVAADIGFAFCRVPHEGLARSRALLLELRRWIPELFSSGLRPGEIWKSVHERIVSEGYDNCHRKYPLQALGHRLHGTSLGSLPGLTIPFSLQSYWSLLSRGLFPEVISPWHSGSPLGLWAVEPHLGGSGFGSKFEEILLVDESGARWLQDDPPHVKLPEGFY